MTGQTTPEFINEAERAGRKSKAGTTLGQVAIARAGLAIADALLVLAKATDRGAAADEAFAAQSAARRQGAPRPVVQAAPPVPSKPVVVVTPTEIMNLTDDETALVNLLREVDEETGFSNLFTEEAVLLAKAVLKKYVPVGDVDTVESEHERIRKAFADFWQKTPYDRWRSKDGRRYEDLGNGWQVGYDLADDVIRGTVRLDG